MKIIEIDQVNYEWFTARVSIWRIDKNTGAYTRNRYKVERGMQREKLLMSVINGGNYRTEYTNNQYNNHGEVLRIYYNADKSRGT